MKEPEHRFLYDMCMAFGKTPSDSFWEEMDPMEKLWLFQSWANKNNLRLEEYKHHAILIGSFHNFEMAKRMSKDPDYVSTDEEFEQSTEIVRKASRAYEEALKGINKKRQSRRRKRKLLKNN